VFRVFRNQLPVLPLCAGGTGATCCHGLGENSASYLDIISVTYALYVCAPLPEDWDPNLELDFVRLVQQREAVSGRLVNDSWEWWDHFRTLCEHHSQLSLALDVR
jgi:hypothetical protein